jgi:wobble nucleotide-excising tRNase
MISNIPKIKNFGCYRDFTWSNLDDFSEKNIIYGWNYSGKTTLSRIFSSLRDKKLHDNYTKGSFNISYSTSSEKSVVTQTNLEEFPYNVRVFNSDFIKENLKWETSNELNGIEFDVGENVNLREQIKNNSDKIVKIKGSKDRKGIIDKYQIPIDEFSKIDKSISEQARKIKNDVFNSAIEFTRSHFVKIKDNIKINYDTYIIDDNTELNRLKNGATSINNKSKISDIQISLSLTDIYDEVKELLLEEPKKTDIITVLEEDDELYKWAEQGISLHKNKKQCSFCDKPIDLDRIQKLSIYYSNAAAKLRERIEKCKDFIADEIDKINRMNLPKSKNDFSESLQDDYQIQLDRKEKIQLHYVHYLNVLLRKLDDKLKDNLFNSIIIDNLKHEIIKDFEKWIVTTNGIITAHSNIINNFEKNQKECREKLKCHYVANFLENGGYIKAEVLKDICERRIEKLRSISKVYEQKNEEIGAQLKSITAGKSKMNHFISVFLNRDDISIDVTSNDKFILKRGIEIAENLSEGEKTAISFSYFLVSLESLGIDTLRETIVFIDDPISSLDSNHISQIYALINAFFFRQELNPNDKNAYVNCFNQLFISTHNFEFFSFLKESNRIKGKKCKFYLVKRIEKDCSVIEGLPKFLRDHKSEYCYLFNLLYKYYNEGCSEQSDNLILLPNAIRRFLEIYTLIKLPGSTEEVDYRLKYLFSGITQIKTLHHFSHFTSFEKITKHDELLMNLPTAVTELFQFLEKDTVHYESLKSTVQ